MPGRRAIFLDRDGVLVEDRGQALADSDLAILPGVPAALAALAAAGWTLVVVSNQPVVARGLISESALHALHQRLAERLRAAGAPLITSWRVCPHHPEATLPAYRVDCACRKPRPGLLLAAAAELGLDLAASWMIGDRASDIAAGLRAGCPGILIESGKHRDPPIRTPDPPRADEQPRHRVADLAAAAALLGRGD